MFRNGQEENSERLVEMRTRRIVNRLYLCLCGWTVLLSGISCKPTSNVTRDTAMPDVESLRPIACVEASREFELSEGQSCAWALEYPVRVTVITVDREKEACELQVEDMREGKKQSGWVKVGAYADFAKEAFGVRGLELREIKDKDIAVLRLNTGEVRIGR